MALAAGSGLAAAATIKLIVDAPRWLGWMPATVGYWSDVAMLFAAVTAALGAWLTLVLRQSRYAVLVGSGSRSQAEQVRHVVVACSVTTASAMTVPLIVAATWTTVAGGNPTTGLVTNLLWWLGTVAAGIAFALLGALIAWWLRRVVAVVLAPALTYGLTVAPLVTMDPPMWSGLYAAQGLAWVDLSPTLTIVVIRAVFWIVMTILLASLLAGAYKIVPVLAVAVSLTASVGMLEGPALRPIPGAVDVVCSGSVPKVCTTTPWTAGLDNFSGLVAESTSVLPSELVPSTIQTFPAQGDDRSDDVLVVEPIGGYIAPTNHLDRDATLSAFGETLFAANCSVSQDPLAVFSLLTWWRIENGIPVDQATRPGDAVPAAVLSPDDYSTVIAQAQAVHTMGTEQRNTWLRENAGAVRECAITMADLP